MNKQKVEHTFEESFCKLLFRKQINKLFFKYCELRFKVNYQKQISMTDHIRFIDSERLKAKLLELFSEKEKALVIDNNSC